jgi:sporulation protein YlmC with PRC-barrel domain
MRFSDLLGKRVVDENGRHRGEVHDVAATQNGPVVGAFGAALQIDALIVGVRGMWARLGFSPAHITGPAIVRRLSQLAGTPDEIPWDQVVRIEDDQIVVRAASGSAPGDNG